MRKYGIKKNSLVSKKTIALNFDKYDTKIHPEVWFMEGSQKIPIISKGEVISNLVPHVSENINSCASKPYYVDMQEDRKRTYYYSYHKDATDLEFNDASMNFFNENVIKPVIGLAKNTTVLNEDGVITGSFDLTYNCQSPTTDKVNGNLYQKDLDKKGTYGSVCVCPDGQRFDVKTDDPDLCNTEDLCLDGKIVDTCSP